MNAFNKSPVGDLAEIIQAFIQYKRSLGYKYKLEESLLYRFSLFSCSYTIPNQSIPKNLVEDWIRRRSGESLRTQALRVSSINVFLKFASENRYDVPLPQKIKRNSSIYIPYIFTNEEIERFFYACDHIPSYPGTQKHIILPVFFRLLYSCGLRVSEATNLKCQDVDLANGVIIVKNGKFKKDRLVPMSNSLFEVMSRYSKLYNQSCKNNDYFFRGKNLKPLSRHYIYRRFRDILVECGISHSGRGKGPRVHDLRHTFCVRTLKQMVDKGADIYCVLPILSTYIGHASINATQGYVRLTADLYPEILEKVSRISGNVIPEVVSNESD